MVRMGGMKEPTNHMTAEEFTQGLAALDWKQVEFADRAGVTKDTVNRWAHGRLPVPAWVAAHLRLLLAAAEFHRAHVAPLPRPPRRKAGADQVEPDTTDLDAQAGMNWWNRATEAERREWCARAGSAAPADAWAAFKASISGSQA